jgi:hypothetical protein
MAALTAVQLNDLVATTIRDLDEPNFTQIAQTLVRYTAMSRLLKKSRRTIQSGYGVQWDVMVNFSGTAENVGLGSQDTIELPDTMVQAQADWRNTKSHWSVIGQEISMNKGKRRIVNLIEARRLAAMGSLAELMETNFWGPPVAITDEVTPWGVKTWIVKNATEGFNGGAPSGFTSIGLNPTTYPTWKNYTALYSAKTKDDLVRKLRRAARRTNFMPIVEGFRDSNKRDMYGFYCNEAVYEAMEEILEDQNESLGDDIAPKDGKAKFLRSDLEWVPKLDADTTDPIYGINWGWYETIVLADWWLKQTVVPVYPGQHTVAATFLDCTYQTTCKNRRENFVVSTATTEPS